MEPKTLTVTVVRDGRSVEKPLVELVAEHDRLLMELTGLPRRIALAVGTLVAVIVAIAEVLRELRPLLALVEAIAR